MSEWQVSAAEYEALDRAHADLVAQRCGYYRRLQNIATLGEIGAVAATGYRSLQNLVADRDNIDHPEAKRLVGEAADLCARTSMLGEQLPVRLPATADALAAGAIDPAHVKIIRDTMRHLAGLMDPPPPDEMAGVEATLAGKAQVLPPKMLRRLAKKFVDFYDPDGAAPCDEEDTADEMHILRRKDGSVVFKGRLGDPLEAEAMVEVFGVLAAPAGSEDRRTVQRRNADGLKDLIHDARGPHGLATDARREPPDGDGAPDAPTSADTDTDQPAADGEPDDADTDVDTDGEPDPDSEPDDADSEPEADWEPDVPPAGETEPASDAEPAGEGEGEPPLALIPEPRRPDGPDASTTSGRGPVERPGRVLLSVTIDHRWLCQALADEGGYGTLDSGHNVDAGTLRRWACDADIVPMILGSKSEPLDVGRRHRTAPDAIRRALNHRDGGCAFPGCDRQPRRCQAHHVRHWTHGGITALDTMCLLCRYHHQLVHHGHWTIEMIDGRPWFTPPWYVDVDRQPRLGGRPRVPV